MSDGDGHAAALSSDDYTAISAFRFELRKFLAFSEAAAARVGLPSQQHQALLTIAGHVGIATVGSVAEQLLIAPHTAAELITRMADAGLVSKTASARDRRRVELSLTPKAASLLQQLTTAHVAELRTLEPALTTALTRVRRERAWSPSRRE